jgi:N-hydroxyarylamine O-acetyltransferase
MTAADLTVDLDAYFARIDYRGPREPTAEALQGIHLAHATHIPFENLDVLAGLPIRIDLAGLQAKLVDARRGGYCFEQNMLLAGMLEAVGFSVKRLLARVRFRAQHLLPLTHMALEVEADGQPWLCDVGFGGHGLLEPLPFAEGSYEQGIWTYRLARENDRWWVLQAPLAEGWIDLYTFTRERYELIDFEPPNFYVYQHPDSIFRKALMAQRPLPDVRYLLVGNDFMEVRPDGTTRSRVESDEERNRILKERFGLVAP